MSNEIAQPANGHILIRHSTRDDRDAIIAIYAEASAYGNTLQLPYPGQALWEKRLTERPDHVRSLVAEHNGEVVGQLSLVAMEHPRRKHVATIGLAVKGSAQGQGVGSALMAAALDIADNWLDTRRVELEVYADNESAIGLYKKFGFEQEGRCRDYAFKGGEYTDALIMARIRKRG